MTNTPTRPETMVERVDRVIREKVLEVYDIMLLNSPGEIGRAAIEAMLEPTVAMIDAAVSHDIQAEHSREAERICWQAMITAALGDG